MKTNFEHYITYHMTKLKLTHVSLDMSYCRQTQNFYDINFSTGYIFCKNGKTKGTSQSYVLSCLRYNYILSRDFHWIRYLNRGGSL